MNLINFAIASIVDANTGYARAHTGGPVEFISGGRDGNQPRSRSGLFSRLRDSLVSFIERSRERAEQRRQLAELAGLSDRSLRDIGLHRGDIHAVESGQVSLEQLQRDRRRRAERNLQSLATGQLDLPRASSNDAAPKRIRCA